MNLISLLSLATTLAVPVLAGASEDATAVCEQLHSAYPNSVIWNPKGSHAAESAFGSGDYDTTVQHYWNGMNAKNKPACIFYPSDAKQVSAAVKQLNQHPQAEFGLKSGGHNFNAGFSSTNGGVLLSFNEHLSSTVRSEDGKSFDVGPGARWGDVYEVAAKTNQVLVGGRLANIGVGGFTLGGGLSYYSPQYGLTCDNVINFEVVLPNGEIVNANSDSNPDLWWALKGGGNRFGIVTKFTFKAHPLGQNGKIWGGIRMYAAEKRTEIFKALSSFIENYPDAKASIIPTFNLGAGSLVAQPMLFFFYDGPTPPDGAFAGLDKIETTSDSTKTTTYTDLTNQAGGAKIYGINAAAHVNTFPNMAPEQMNTVLEQHWQIYQAQMKNDTSKSLDLQFGTFTPQPLSVRIAQASANNGGNALGLDPQNGDRFWVENDLIWINPACDSTCPQHLRDTCDQVKSAFTDKFGVVKPTNYKSGDVEFVSTNPLFMNDAGYYQDVYSSYGTANKEKLEQIVAKYDPNHFMFRQGGWKFS